MGSMAIDIVGPDEMGRYFLILTNITGETMICGRHDSYKEAVMDAANTKLVSPKELAKEMDDNK